MGGRWNESSRPNARYTHKKYLYTCTDGRAVKCDPYAPGKHHATRHSPLATRSFDIEGLRFTHARKEYPRARPCALHRQASKKDPTVRGATRKAPSTSDRSWEGHTVPRGGRGVTACAHQSVAMVLGMPQPHSMQLNAVQSLPTNSHTQAHLGLVLGRFRWPVDHLAPHRPAHLRPQDM